MDNEIMNQENEIVEERRQSLRVNSNGNTTTYELSPEAVAAVCELGASVLGKAIDAKREALIAAVDREMELQISQMENSVKSQTIVLDKHESNQHELLSNYLQKQELYAQYANNSTSLEEKSGWLDLIKETENKMAIMYLDNNKQLDLSLEKAKHRTGGVLEKLFSKFGR